MTFNNIYQALTNKSFKKIVEETTNVKKTTSNTNGETKILCILPAVFAKKERKVYIHIYESGFVYVNNECDAEEDYTTYNIENAQENQFETSELSFNEKINLLFNYKPNDCDFTYNINNQEIEITAYVGKEKQIEIPSTIDGLEVTKIGENAFTDNKTITKITMPHNIKNIGKCCFSNCVSLIEITLSNMITTIEHSTFDGCKTLQKIELPENLKAIKAAAFKDCCSLTKINIPNNVTIIENRAFYNCYNLIDINLSDNLMFIIGVTLVRVQCLTMA